VTQESFVRAYASLHRLRRDGAWEAWLMRILRNLCADALRRRRDRPTEPIDLDWAAGGPSPEAAALQAERSRDLDLAVSGLPEKYRVPLLMRYASHRSLAEWVSGSHSLRAIRRPRPTPPHGFVNMMPQCLDLGRESSPLSKL